MKSGADVLVIGAGPAGAAAAIEAASAGLSVVLIDRAIRRERPGETLHPGAESLFERLGVAGAISNAAPIRHAGVTTIRDGVASEVRYGADARGPWRGYQIRGAMLDAMLIARARALGAEWRAPARAEAPLRDGARVTGAMLAGRPFHASVTIDATGGADWLRRGLGLRQVCAGPRLFARYGYCTGPAPSENPQFVCSPMGWSWIAQVEQGLVAWTRVQSGALTRGAPDPIAHLPPRARERSADVTCRLLTECAGPGYFVAGDAAALLDPASSHGVLRALMSGMMSAYLANKIVRGALTGEAAAQHYRRWIRTWFTHDAAKLQSFYQRLDPSWTAAFNAATAA
ncbi:MAG: FAD-dependent monooxygenase [Terricaulis sp.]